MPTPRVSSKICIEKKKLALHIDKLRERAPNRKQAQEEPHMARPEGEFF